MMKMTKTLSPFALSVSLGLATVMASGSAVADEFDYPQNPVKRPITLSDGMVSLSAAVGNADELDGDEESFIVANAQYGVTDNFTIGFDGLTYRFYDDDALQLAVNTGVRDAFETDELGDNAAVGIGVFGKQVLSNDFALTFGIDFIHWDIDNLDDREEVNYQLGFMYNLSNQWTLSAGYTYRDLEDFSESSANAYRAALTYTGLKNIDIGLFAVTSDYDDTSSGYWVRDEVEQGAGIYVNWRF